MITAEAEREKYRRMFAHPSYRIGSPGQREVVNFLRRVPWTKGDTLVDLGAGCGWASRDLAKAGLNVFMLDIVKSVDEDINLPFIESCLWTLPESLQFDWIYSVDVMEHIPPEHVDAVLDGMAKMTRRGGVIQVAMFPDDHGKFIGEKLHLTVMPEEWWREKIAARWRITGWESIRDPRATAYLGEAL